MLFIIFILLFVKPIWIFDMTDRHFLIELPLLLAALAALGPRYAPAFTVKGKVIALDRDAKSEMPEGMRYIQV